MTTVIVLNYKQILRTNLKRSVWSSVEELSVGLAGKEFNRQVSLLHKFDFLSYNNSSTL